MGTHTNADGFITLDNKVKLKPYKARPFSQIEYLSDNDLISNAGGTLIGDTECYANWFCCNFKLHKTNKVLIFECGNNLSFNERKLSWVLNNYRVIGFNWLKYDNDMVWLSYKTQDVSILKDCSNDIILNGIRTKDLQKKYNFRSHRTNIVDLLEVAPLKGSLKLYGARLHSPRIQDLPFPDYEELTAEQIEIVKQYNFNDLDVTEQLFDFMKERLELREAMSLEYNEDLMSKSDAQIAEAVLVKEVGKLNGKRPQRQEVEPGTVYRYSIPSYIRYQTPALNKLLEKLRVAKFIVQPSGKIAIPDELTGAVDINKGSYRIGIGGLHSSEKTVAYVATPDVDITDDDVASYYPRLITTLGLYPPSCGLNFLTAFEKIIKVRLDAKERKLFTRDKGLKIVINGTSGKLSDVWSTFYSPDNTIQMTVSGQLALLMLIEMFELAGIEVVSANTDGIVKLVRKDKRDIKTQIIKRWENATGFVTEETKYKSYYARDVNSYFAVKLDGSVKKKGPYSEVGSQSGTKLDTNPVVLICSDAIESLLSKSIPIEDTILNCKDFTRFVTVRQAKAPGAHKNGEYLGKVIRWYYAKGETGCIQTVATNNKVADSDGARPAMDLPKEWPEDLDYSWYINKTKEILVDIGHTKKAKQLQFF